MLSSQQEQESKFISNQSDYSFFSSGHFLSTASSKLSSKDDKVSKLISELPQEIDNSKILLDIKTIKTSRESKRFFLNSTEIARIQDATLASITRIKSYISHPGKQYACLNLRSYFMFDNQDQYHVNIQLFVFYLPKIEVFPNINFKVLADSLSPAESSVDKETNPLVILLITKIKRKCYLYLSSFLTKFTKRPIHIIVTQLIANIIHMDQHLTTSMLSRIRISVLTNHTKVFQVINTSTKDNFQLPNQIYQSLLDSPLIKEAEFTGYTFTNSALRHPNSDISTLLLNDKIKEYRDNNKNNRIQPFAAKIVSVYVLNSANVNLELNVNGLERSQLNINKYDFNDNCNKIEASNRGNIIEKIVDAHTEFGHTLNKNNICLYNIKPQFSATTNNISVGLFETANWIHLNLQDNVSVTFEFMTQKYNSKPSSDKSYLFILTTNNNSTSQVFFKSFDLNNNIHILTNLTKDQIKTDNPTIFSTPNKDIHRSSFIYITNITNDVDKIVQLNLLKTKKGLLQAVTLFLESKKSYISRINMDDSQILKKLGKGRYYQIADEITVVFSLDYNVWLEMENWTPDAFYLMKGSDCQLKKFKGSQMFGAVCNFKKIDIINTIRPNKRNCFYIDLYGIWRGSWYQIVPSICLIRTYSKPDLSSLNETKMKTTILSQEPRLEIYKDSTFSHPINNNEVLKNSKLYIRISSQLLNDLPFDIDSCFITRTRMTTDQPIKNYYNYSRHLLFRNGCFSRSHDQYDNTALLVVESHRLYKFQIILNATQLSVDLDYKELISQKKPLKIHFYCGISVCPDVFKEIGEKKLCGNQMRPISKCISKSIEKIIYYGNFTVQTTEQSKIPTAEVNGFQIKLITMICLSILTLILLFILAIMFFRIMNCVNFDHIRSIFRDRKTNHCNYNDNVNANNNSSNNNNNNNRRSNFLTCPAITTSDLREQSLITNPLLERPNSVGNKSRNICNQYIVNSTNSSNHNLNNVNDRLMLRNSDKTNEVSVVLKAFYLPQQSSQKNVYGGHESKFTNPIPINVGLSNKSNNPATNQSHVSSYSWPPQPQTFINLDSNSQKQEQVSSHLSNRTNNTNNNNNNTTTNEIGIQLHNNNTTNTTTTGTIGTICGSTDIVTMVTRKTSSLQRWWAWIRNDKFYNNHTITNCKNSQL